MADTLHTVDPSTEPFLSGRFAPVGEEISADRLEVTGALPDDLTGAYVRNGPNPRFTPLGSYTYPLEGDGMVHGVWLDGGNARYANRYVRTQGMLAEEKAGRALFGGIMTPAFVDPSLLGDDPTRGGRSSSTRSSTWSGTVAATWRWRRARRRTRSQPSSAPSVAATSPAGCPTACAPTPRSIPRRARWWCSATTSKPRS